MKKENTEIVHGHFEAIRKMLNDRAYIDQGTDDGSVHLLFQTLEMALVVKNQFEREINQMFPRRIVRWKWSSWQNRPECLIAQIGITSKLEKFTPEKFIIEDNRARATCQCYNCAVRNKAA